VLVSSRSVEEYAAFFALDLQSLRGLRVLDCSAGASNFVARATRAGVRAVAVDPAYAMPRDELATLSARSSKDGNAIALAHGDRFTWSWYGTAEARERLRNRALAEFVLDLGERPQHYVAAALPSLPFGDKAFDLAVCSHLAFTWADQLGRGWHRAALAELSRVAREARLFPTVMQGAGEPVPFWDELMHDLGCAGIETELRRVSYEFQVGADTMLVLRH
jgi:SAM-dependent methyltransferase